MTLFHAIRHRWTRHQLVPPIGVVHIPKAAGTAMINRIEAGMRPRKYLYGLDRSQFGSFAAFESMPPSMLQTIFLDPDEIPVDCDMLAGHLSPGTIRARLPNANIITRLRAPVPRLLSHWFYWRSYSDDVLAQYGAWGAVLAGARAELAEFLQIRGLACVTDNILVRMLLWPHPLIPSGDFIDPAHDAALVREASRALASFANVTIMEDPKADERLTAWLRQNYGLSVWSSLRKILYQSELVDKNTSKIPTLKIHKKINQQLRHDAAGLVANHCRLDDQIWYASAEKIFTRTEARSIYEHQITTNIERYERLSDT